MNDSIESYQLLREKEVCKLISISRTTLWRWHNWGDFPRPIHLGANTVRWRSADVIKWLHKRVEESIGKES